jgi:hypothetical protein
MCRGYRWNFGQGLIVEPTLIVVDRAVSVSRHVAEYLSGKLSGWAFRDQLERIPVTLKRSLHVGSNWRILAD